jgi:hypothetical protein
MKYFTICITVVCILCVCGVVCAQPPKPAPRDTGAEHLQKPFRNPVDNPQLPRVLLIGDSISIGYTVPVRILLDGKANVHRVPENCRNAEYGLQHLDKWLGTSRWDVIHFNFGLWDICYRHPDSKVYGNRDKVKGKITATPQQYLSTMEAIVACLKQTGAKLIWCATSPVPNEEAGRKKGDEKKYNEIAAEIMKKHGIRINDLHRHARKKTPEIFVRKGDVHYTKEGYAYLAEKVSEEIKKALPEKKKSTTDKTNKPD